MSKALKFSKFKLFLANCANSIRLICFFIFIHFSAFNQTHNVSTAVGITRFDVFHSFGYSFDTNRFEYSASLGYGINRTLFQQKLFPRISVGFQYSALKKKRFQLGPMIAYSFSCIKFNPTSKLTSWNELNIGISWSYGGKWKIGQTISAGYVGQSHFSTLQQKRVTGNTWGYYTDLKLIYAL